jgi:hypothetical protein
MSWPDDGAHIRVILEFPEGSVELRNEGFREAVPCFGPIERENRDAAIHFAQQDRWIWRGGARGLARHRLIQLISTIFLLG